MTALPDEISRLLRFERGALAIELDESQQRSTHDGGSKGPLLPPDTFEIPDEAVRSRLVPTSDAKLIFTLRGVEGPQVERMWVHITGYTETGYVGVLDNEPRTPDSDRAGQTVEFGPEHIIDALPPANWNPETREYED